MGTNLGRLLLRVTVGSIFIEHGTQKLFGWFGGHGPSGTGQFCGSLGLRPGRRNAIVAGIAEAGGGAFLVLGLATPAAASAVGSVMVTALRTAIWRDEIKVGTGGYELLPLGGSRAWRGARWLCPRDRRRQAARRGVGFRTAQRGRDNSRNVLANHRT
jgi:uncharacterized membrane protein YphA (DoxX/SURF4 family)